MNGVYKLYVVGGVLPLWIDLPVDDNSGWRICAQGTYDFCHGVKEELLRRIPGTNYFTDMKITTKVWNIGSGIYGYRSWPVDDPKGNKRFIDYDLLEEPRGQNLG